MDSDPIEKMFERTDASYHKMWREQMDIDRLIQLPLESLEAHISLLTKNLGDVAYSEARRAEIHRELNHALFERSCRMVEEGAIVL